MPHLDDGVLHAYLDGALPLDTHGAAEVQEIERHLSDNLAYLMDSWAEFFGDTDDGQ